MFINFSGKRVAVSEIKAWEADEEGDVRVMLKGENGTFFAKPHMIPVLEQLDMQGPPDATTLKGLRSLSRYLFRPSSGYELRIHNGDLETHALLHNGKLIVCGNSLLELCQRIGEIES